MGDKRLAYEWHCMEDKQYRMKARWIGSEIRNTESLTHGGDIATGADNYHGNLLVRCPICDELHVITLSKNGWQWNESTLTLQPSAKMTGHLGVCHWSLTKGLFIMWPDSTAWPQNKEIET